VTDQFVPNEIGAEYPDRDLNRAVATYTTQLHMAERDLATAEAYALSIASSLGSNAEDRKRNGVLYLAGHLDMSVEQGEAVQSYRRCLTMVDKIEHDPAYLKAEMQSRRHERTESNTAALERYTDLVGVITGAFPNAPTPLAENGEVAVGVPLSPPVKEAA
jgi:hypothetical protein